MPRIARVVVPGMPHHVVQRGNRNQQTFFLEGDYLAYLELMNRWLGKYGVEVWAYCLMSNHVHLIVVPPTEDSLRRSIGEAHRHYTLRVNARYDWRGHLWQGRFASFPMDESHLLAAARYIELNPVQAGLVVQPWEYRWSSAAAHLSGQDDRLVRVQPLLALIPDWREFLIGEAGQDYGDVLHHHERTGRPAGDDTLVEQIQNVTGRDLHTRKVGRPPKKS
jgi:putative transposase